VQPTLVVHGHRDIMLPLMNAFVLSQHIPNAQLIIYPKSGHGALFQVLDPLCAAYANVSQCLIHHRPT
jgi:pimeloyl-ACP methyl ester carboxylesterase